MYAPRSSSGCSVLAFFPSPYEDELLYSLLARYARLTGYSNLKTNLHDLFGRTTVIAVADLPTHLGSLAERLAPLGGLSADEMIDHYTLFPYYVGFQPSERRRKVREAMRGDGSPHGLLGLMAARGPALNALRYCPVCASRERRRYREAYWHRSHQLPGVLACEAHGTWLEESEVVLPAPVMRHAFAAAETVIPYGGFARRLSSAQNEPLILDLTQRAQALATSPTSEFDLAALRSHYRNALAERRLATYSGRLRLEALRQDIETFLPEELRDRLGVPPVDGWLLRLLRKPRTVAHPLYHLLLQAFLDTDRDVLQMPIRFFGEGPWPCLNRAASHYGERRVAQVEVGYTRNAREPIGTFTCTCGFSYRRVGPDRTPSDTFRIDRMAAFGSVWSQVLEQGWYDPSFSLRELARRLGVDTRTVRKQAAALGLPYERSGSRAENAVTPEEVRPEVEEVAFAERRASYRDAWFHMKDKRPNASIKALRADLPGVYIWLYRNDRTWFDENKPTRRTPRASAARVDWARRDADLAHLLRRAALQVLTEAKPVRLTRSRLGRMIGYAGMLDKNLNKLPECKVVLDEIMESREAFAVRRIRLASSHLRESGGQVPRWQFARLCGLRPEMLEKSEVANAFERAWASVKHHYELPAA